MAAQCIASRLHDFLYRRDQGEVVDRIRREVVSEFSPKDRLCLRASDLLLPRQQTKLFDLSHTPRDAWIPGSYRVLVPGERKNDSHQEEREE